MSEFAFKVTFKVVLSTILTTLLVASEVVQAQENKNVSLQTAIKTALEKNPRIKSNDKILQAILYRVEAEKKSQLPSINLGYSLSRNLGQTSDSLGNNSNYNSGSRGGNLSINWNIFDGGAKKYRIESMECGFKQSQANYNSTNTQSRNTQGQIAGLVVNSYISLTAAKTNIMFDQKIMAYLNKVKTVAKTEGEISQVMNFISMLTHDLEVQSATVESESGNYKFVVNEPAPENLDRFEQMIASIQIPATAADAREIARLKSPEIKSAQFQLECSKLRYKSVQASYYSPQVNVSVGRSFGNKTNDYTNHINSASNGTSLNVSVQMHLSAGSSSELMAENKEIDAAQDNLDATISDTEHDLDQTFPVLNNGLRFIEFYKNSLNMGDEKIARYLQDIDSHKPVVVDDINKEIGTLFNNWLSLQRYTISVIDAKFQIQKTMGTLFESLGLQQQGASQVVAP